MQTPSSPDTANTGYNKIHKIEELLDLLLKNPTCQFRNILEKHDELINICRIMKSLENPSCTPGNTVPELQQVDPGINFIRALKRKFSFGSEYLVLYSHKKGYLDPEEVCPTSLKPRMWFFITISLPLSGNIYLIPRPDNPFFSLLFDTYRFFLKLFKREAALPEEFNNHFLLIKGSTRDADIHRLFSPELRKTLLTSLSLAPLENNPYLSTRITFTPEVIAIITQPATDSRSLEELIILGENIRNAIETRITPFTPPPGESGDNVSPWI